MTREAEENSESIESRAQWRDGIVTSDECS